MVVAHARVALVAGATGLVGRAILAALLADKRYAAVHCVGRRALPLQHPKLLQQVVDFACLPTLPPVDDCFIALGTTLKVAGSKSAFRAIDLEAVVAVARAAHASGATQCAAVSAMGAAPQSRIFYNRVKGEMEAALAMIGFDRLVLARPAMLAGPREALNQPQRPGEQIALRLSKALKPLIPSNYRSIATTDVAQAMLQALHPGSPGVHVLLSGAMQGAAQRSELSRAQTR